MFVEDAEAPRIIAKRIDVTLKKVFFNKFGERLPLKECTKFVRRWMGHCPC